jgi:hypothetical protein
MQPLEPCEVGSIRRCPAGATLSFVDVAHRPPRQMPDYESYTWTFHVIQQ